MRCSSEQELLERLTTLPKNYDAVVVEGYDGVGKGKVLNLLSEFYNVEPYRPDYNLWQKYDLRPQDPSYDQISRQVLYRSADYGGDCLLRQ